MRAQETRADMAADGGRTRRTTPGTPANRLLALQRTAGNAAVARAVEEERHEHGAGCGHTQSSVEQSVEKPQVQRSSVSEALLSPSRPLDPGIRAKAEQGLGMDFGNVRVHTGSVAQRSAVELGALAYTTGQDIVVGPRGADAETMFHELDHVRQQSLGPVAGTDNGAGAKVSSSDDAFEQQSAANGRKLAQGAAPDLSLPGGRTHAVSQDAEQSAVVARHAVQRAPAGSSGKVTKSKGRGGKRKAATTADAVKKELVDNFGWESHGANQSLTLHKVTRSQAASEQAGTTGRTTKQSQMYAGSSNEVGARSYAGERTKQVLRWISTVVDRCLRDAGERPEEVQSAMATDTEVENAFHLFISTNRTKVNNLVREGSSGKAAEEYITELLANVAAVSVREIRHSSKLKSLLAKKARDEVPADFWNIVKALSGPLTVPEPGTDGKHAERTIMESVPAGSVGQHDIAGVKRPCVACYMALYQGSGRHPGPYWPSGAANIDTADYSIEGAATLAQRIDTAVTAAGGTFVSIVLDCGGEHAGVAWDHDTDSDSPASSSDSEPERGADRMDTSA